MNWWGRCLRYAVVVGLLAFLGWAGWGEESKGAILHLRALPVGEGRSLLADKTTPAGEVRPRPGPGASSESLPRGPVNRATVTVAFYYPSRDGSFLVPEVRSVPQAESSPGRIIEELLRGPTLNQTLISPFPAGTRLLDWRLATDGTLVADFSRELVTRHWGGTSGELATVYSLVNTVTRLPGVRRVRFEVEGEPVETLAGHVDLREPLTFDATLVWSGDGGNQEP